jgi:hypothetical protein
MTRLQTSTTTGHAQRPVTEKKEELLSTCAHRLPYQIKSSGWRPSLLRLGWLARSQTEKVSKFAWLDD